MKAKSFLLPFAVLTLLVFSAVSAHSQTVVTFDDLNETGSGAFFSSLYQGYQGLTWSNIACNNAILFTNVQFNGAPPDGRTGDYYGMVSKSNVAEMITGCEIDSFNTNFNFQSAFLTGFWNSNLNIEVQGFNGTTLLYDTTVVASAISPTLFTFDYQNISRLFFTSSGGQAAFGAGGASNLFVMDNFTFEFIPEPSSLLLTGLAALLLCLLLRRKRAT